MTGGNSIDYEAWMVDIFLRLSEMDPDELVSELNLSSFDILHAFADVVRQYADDNFTSPDEEHEDYDE